MRIIYVYTLKSKEISDKAWEAAMNYYEIEAMGENEDYEEWRKRGRETFMKELFK